MTNTEYMLICLAEECAEISEQCSKVAIRASKALRFGLDEAEAGQIRTNTQRIWAEVADLLATAEVLIDLGVITRDDIDRKKAKIEKFMAYAAGCGVLGGG